jgi:AraC-like DNA-binding protein
MNTKKSQLVKRDARVVESYQSELVERIARAIPEDGTVEPFQDVYLRRFSSPTEPLLNLAAPNFHVIAQGSKEAQLGEERYRYDPYYYCISTVELPVVTHIVEATKERPYLSVSLELDSILVGTVMSEAGQTPPSEPSDVNAFSVNSLDADLLDAVVRLVRLIENPTETPVLVPLVKREIVYRLLMGEQGERLRHIAIFSGYTPPIAKVIERLHRDLDRPMRIENIARELGMSVSGFHHHFKAVTAMSPLQFQKRLRLQEARRLMLGEGLDAASAGYRVGYHNAAHFNREYKGLFGLPPMRDMERLRGVTKGNIGLAAD